MFILIIAAVVIVIVFCILAAVYRPQLLKAIVFPIIITWRWLRKLFGYSSGKYYVSKRELEAQESEICTDSDDCNMKSKYYTASVMRGPNEAPIPICSLRIWASNSLEVPKGPIKLTIQKMAPNTVESTMDK